MRWIGHTLRRKPPEILLVKPSHGTPPPPPPPEGKAKRTATEHQTKTQQRKERRWDTPGERWTRWPQTDNSGVTGSMAYAPSEQKGVSE